MGFRGVQNLKGREPGKPNIVTQEVRNSFANLLEKNITQIDEDIQKLKPYERIRVILELAKFVVPTLKQMEVNENLGREVQPVILKFSHED